MLDRTSYSTRTDLTSDELMLLIRVRTGLENETIKARQFVMETTWCGTAGCIGGWMDYFNGRYDDRGYLLSNRPRSVMGEDIFKALFYPSEWKMKTATPADGIRAINNFLADKAKPWGFMRRDGSHAR